MIASSVHWRNDRLVVYVTADHPVDAPEVVRTARRQVRLYLDGDARLYRVGPRRRAMTFRRAYVYAFVGVSDRRQEAVDAG